MKWLRKYSYYHYYYFATFQNVHASEKFSVERQKKEGKIENNKKIVRKKKQNTKFGRANEKDDRKLNGRKTLNFNFVFCLHFVRKKLKMKIYRVELERKWRGKNTKRNKKKKEGIFCFSLSLICFSIFLVFSKFERNWNNEPWTHYVEEDEKMEFPFTLLLIFFSLFASTHTHPHNDTG